MSGRAPDSLIERGIELRERGYSVRQISALLGGGRNTWDYRFMSRGIFPPHNTSFTEIKPLDATIERMRIDGESIMDIALHVSKSKSYVQSRLLRVNVRHAADEL